MDQMIKENQCDIIFKCTQSCSRYCSYAKMVKDKCEYRSSCRELFICTNQEAMIDVVKRDLDIKVDKNG